MRVYVKIVIDDVHCSNGKIVLQNRDRTFKEQDERMVAMGVWLGLVTVAENNSMQLT
jgi:hypothetical protein